MSGEQKLASILIALHMVALSVVSIPDPRLLPVITAATAPDRRPGPLTRPLDGAVTMLAGIEPTLYRLVEPMRFLTAPYITAGIGPQQWYMFASPYTFDVYLRADAFVASGGERQPSRIYRELLLPAYDETKVRLYHRYRDKAILTSLEGVSRDQLGGNSEEALRRLEPIGRFFRSELQRQLTPGDRVARVELWYSTAPIPPPGKPEDTAMVADRTTRLAPYWSRPAEVMGRSFDRRRLGTTERESDMVWTLTYIDQP